ncbi:MAG TPA: AI-2E family transporter [Terriglobales bacterium]|nr:AI-2E family transporter [Terriglobales bacterium]
MPTEEVPAFAPPTLPKMASGAPRPRHWALNVLGIAVLFALCYYGQVVLVVVLTSILIAFILAPAVDLLMRFRLPRALAAAVVLLLLLAFLAGVVSFSYSQAARLVADLPKYADKLRSEVMRFRERAESLQVLSPQQETGIVNVRPATDWTDLLSRGFGSVGQAMFAASFVPFLVYFMLTWQHHVRSATVMLFPMENRNTAWVTLGLISSMIRSFMVGNVLIGLLLGAASTVFFWMLNVPFFYFVGFISGFLSLVPYLGLVLALAPPIFVSIGRLESPDILTIAVIVFALHLFALNILYPKLLGNRLQLNPLAVTIALLLWAWLWGGVGLVLAIPITAAMKIIFDHVEALKPYGVWLGE